MSVEQCRKNTDFLHENALFSVFTVLIPGYICSGEEETSADNSAPGKNILNNERWSNPNPKKLVV